MTAYIIWDSAVLNGEGPGNYVNLAAQSLPAHSGRFLIQGRRPWPLRRATGREAGL